MIYIGNVFTGSMIKEPSFKIKAQKIDWTFFDKMMEKDFVSFMGHKDIAKMVSVPFNRISVKAKKGDTIIVAQYEGERLPEGTTQLPKGSKLIPMMYKIY